MGQITLDGKPLSEQTLKELKARREIAKMFIKILEAMSDSEPNKFEALKRTHSQADEIQAAITALDPTDKPQDVVVSVRSAKMDGTVPKP